MQETAEWRKIRADNDNMRRQYQERPEVELGKSQRAVENRKQCRNLVSEVTCGATLSLVVKGLLMMTDVLAKTFSTEDAEEWAAADTIMSSTGIRVWGGGNHI